MDWPDDEFVALAKKQKALFYVPNLPDSGAKTDLSWLSDSVSAQELTKLQAGASTDRPDVQKLLAEGVWYSPANKKVKLDAKYDAKLYNTELQQRVARTGMKLTGLYGNVTGASSPRRRLTYTTLRFASFLPMMTKTTAFFCAKLCRNSILKLSF